MPIHVTFLRPIRQQRHIFLRRRLSRSILMLSSTTTAQILWRPSSVFFSSTLVSPYSNIRQRALVQASQNLLLSLGISLGILPTIEPSKLVCTFRDS